MPTLKYATTENVSLITDLLFDMQKELGELAADKETFFKTVTESLHENVHWFLFYDDEGQEPFGTCYMQSVHNYWRIERRFYLGGFYIRPGYRGKGRFRAIYNQLKNWVSDHGGCQIYAHIHTDNEKSLSVFRSAGMEAIEYELMVDNWGD